MSELNDILIQLDKERIKKTEDRWTTGQGVRVENEFPQSDHPQPPTNTTTYTQANTFNTMKKQIRKKKISKKSKSERVSEKSISLSERLSIPVPK
jgi:hypothetical protein